MSTTTDSELIGAFDAIVAGEPGVDRHEVFARLRRELPIFYSQATSAWVVSRYDDVKAVLQDADVFVPITEGPGASVFGGGFFHWRGREHNKKAGIVGRRIRSPGALRREISGKVSALANELADALPIGAPVDLREDFTMQVPLLVIARLTDIDEATKLRHWYDTIMAGGTSSIGNPGAREAALRAMQELKEFLVPLLEQRRATPGEDLVSDLVTARYDDEPLPDDEIVSIVGQLLPAGVETTAAPTTRWPVSGPRRCGSIRRFRPPTESRCATRRWPAPPCRPAIRWSSCSPPPIVMRRASRSPSGSNRTASSLTLTGNTPRRGTFCRLAPACITAPARGWRRWRLSRRCAR
jgi:hypothetical protein